MKLNSTELKFKTLCLSLPLSLRIKEGLPRLILNRLPDNQEFTETGWCKIQDSQGAFLSWGVIDPINNAIHLISSSEADPIMDFVARFEVAFNKRFALKNLKGQVLRLVNSTGDNLSGFTLEKIGTATIFLPLNSSTLSIQTP